MEIKIICGYLCGKSEKRKWHRITKNELILFLMSMKDMDNQPECSPYIKKWD